MKRSSQNKLKLKPKGSRKSASAAPGTGSQPATQEAFAWGEPPPRARNGQGGKSRYLPLLERLKEKPGTWARLIQGTPFAVQGVKSTLKNVDPGKYEFATRKVSKPDEEPEVQALWAVYRK